LTLVALGFTVAWGLMAVFGRPIGDYGVETDFYGDFVPTAHRWMHDGPQVGNGFRGPFYYVLLGLLGQSFTAGKLLSVLASGVALRLLGRIVEALLDRRAALLAMLALGANPTFVELTFRAASDPVFLALFTGVLALCLPGATATGKAEGAATSPRAWRRWGSAGILAGCAWLTRYNGIALLPAGLVFAVCFPRARRTTAIGAFLAGWLVVALPWALFLWKQTGDPLWNTNYQNLAIAVYAPDPSLAQQGGFMKAIGFASTGEVLSVDVRRVLLALGRSLFTHIALDVTTMVTWPWAVVSLAGYALTWGRWTEPRRLVFLSAGVITYLSLLPAFHNPRFMIPLLVWWMTGIAALGIAIPELVKRKNAKRQAFLAAVIVLSGTVAWTETREMRRSLDRASTKACPYEILVIAREAKRLHLPIDEKTPVAARKPQIGYYLRAPVVSIPYGGLDELRNAGAHYLLVSAAEAMQSSSLMPLLEPQSNASIPRGLRLVAKGYAEVGGGRYRPAALYAVENPKPYVPPPRVPARPARDTVAGMSRIDTLRLRLARWQLIWAPDLSLSSLFGRMSPAARASSEVLALEGDEQLMRGDRRKAKQRYASMPPGDAAHLRLAGVAYLEGDRTGMADELASMHGQRTARDWYLLANQQQTRGEFAAAVAPFVACIDADASAGPCYEGLAETLLQAGENERAIRVLRDGLERLPNDPELKGLLEQLESGAKRVALGPR
jgi:4-amino-4-deoxy-L-arabinose transferase-like glycosyltransferase